MRDGAMELRLSSTGHDLARTAVFDAEQEPGVHRDRRGSRSPDGGGERCVRTGAGGVLVVVATEVERVALLVLRDPVAGLAAGAARVSDRDRPQPQLGIGEDLVAEVRRRRDRDQAGIPIRRGAPRRGQREGVGRNIKDALTVRRADDGGQSFQHPAGAEQLRAGVRAIGQAQLRRDARAAGRNVDREDEAERARLVATPLPPE